MIVAPVIALLLSAVLPAATSYVPLYPHELALQSELIVDGTIVAFDAPRSSMFVDKQHVFRLRVETVVAGTCEAKTLTVRQFGDWMCAARYADYATGQRAIFHLSSSRREDGSVETDAPWRVRGAGNEGECPLADDQVLVRGYGFFRSSAKHRAFGHDFTGISLPRDDYIEAVRSLRALFRWEPYETKRWRRFRGTDIERRGNAEQLAAFARSSATAGALLQCMPRTSLAQSDDE